MIRDPQNLKEVIIKLRDEEVYRGTDLNIMFNLDISEMWNGRAVMRVETMTETGIASVQESIFMIYNR